MNSAHVIPNPQQDEGSAHAGVARYIDPGFESVVVESISHKRISDIKNKNF